MPLSSRNLIVACSLACVCLLLATPVCGQSNYGQQIQPNNPLGVSVYQSSQIIDHSSMSPDSWSAPPITNIIPYTAPSTTLPYSAPNQSFSPSIPDLGAAAATHSPRQLNSLIRQPGTAGIGPPAAQSPFKSAKYSTGAQTGLPLSAPGQVTSENPFRAAAGKLLNAAQAPNPSTSEFELGSNFRNLPATPTPRSTPPPLFGGSPIPPTAERYPLGINGNLPTSPQANQLLASPPSENAYHSLLNTPTTVPQSGPSYPSYSSAVPSSPLFTQPALTEQTIGSLPAYRPDLGHRSPNPTFRGRDHDNGLKMDFEDKKKEYPGLGEILATGRYFGSFSGLFLQPAFQQNSVITQFNSSASAATFASSEAFDFDYETAPRFRLGFESRFGPGIELDYWQFDQGSNVSSFTSTGLNSGQLSSGLFGPSTLTTLEAVNAGETLSAIHSIDIETFSILFFKEIKFPISRLNGMFGFQYASVFQELEAELTDAGGNLIGEIRSTSDLRAYGPKFRFEYYRPIGHTNLEFVTAFGGSVLFGERDQIITNNQTPAVNQFGADEYVLTSDFYGGVQWKKLTAENRAYYVRLGVTHQSWIGGGSAVSASDNFGLRGFAFEFGLNR